VDPVTPELPSAPNGAAVPRGGATWAKAAHGMPSRAAQPATASKFFLPVDLRFMSRGSFVRGELALGAHIDVRDLAL